MTTYLALGDAHYNIPGSAATHRTSSAGNVFVSGDLHSSHAGWTRLARINKDAHRQWGKKGTCRKAVTMIPYTNTLQHRRYCVVYTGLKHAAKWQTRARKTLAIWSGTASGQRGGRGSESPLGSALCCGNLKQNGRKCGHVWVPQLGVCYTLLCIYLYTTKMS